MANGKFIVIDGTDGSGKTVQANRLIERLRAAGKPTELSDFPRYGKPSAQLVEKYLAGGYPGIGAQAASLLFAVDRFDAAPGLRQKLAEGSWLVSNRYVSANKGHQMGKIADPDGQVQFLGWLNQTEYGIFGIPKPDLTILLHVPAEIGYGLARNRDGAKRDIHQQDLEHLRAAERAFLRLPEIDHEENWRVVECVADGKLMPVDAIHERVWQLVETLL